MGGQSIQEGHWADMQQGAAASRTQVRKGPEVGEFSLRKERGDGEAKETTSGGGAGMVPRQSPSHLDWTQDAGEFAEGSTATWGGVTAALTYQQ